MLLINGWQNYDQVMTHGIMMQRLEYSYVYLNTKYKIQIQLRR